MSIHVHVCVHVHEQVYFMFIQYACSWFCYPPFSNSISCVMNIQVNMDTDTGMDTYCTCPKLSAVKFTSFESAYIHNFSVASASGLRVAKSASTF